VKGLFNAFKMLVKAVLKAFKGPSKSLLVNTFKWPSQAFKGPSECLIKAF
jgi:hypothetical protein